MNEDSGRPFEVPKPPYLRDIAPQYVSGISRTAHVVWAVVTILTFGVGAIGWALHALLGRRRIS